MKIADGVEMLELSSNIMGTTMTVYPTLLWDSGTMILVDSGYPGQLDQIRAAVEKAGLSFSALNHVLLTHHDIDHIGGLPGIRGALSGQVKGLAYVEEKPYIDGEKRPLKLVQMEAHLDALPEEAKSTYAMLNRAFQNAKNSVDSTLADGQELPYCGGITVIHTPGHTLGHICLYLSRQKTLIAGDALLVENGALVVPPPFMNYDTNLCVQSLKKLAEYDIERVICYHGGLYQEHASRSIAALARGTPVL